MSQPVGDCVAVIHLNFCVIFVLFFSGKTVLFDTAKEEGGAGAEGGRETCRSEECHGGTGKAGQAKVSWIRFFSLIDGLSVS